MAFYFVYFAMYGILFCLTNFVDFVLLIFLFVFEKELRVGREENRIRKDMGKGNNVIKIH